MIVSPYRTQLTRMIQNGEREPTRSDVNRKAIGKPMRKAAWEAKNKKPD